MTRKKIKLRRGTEGWATTGRAERGKKNLLGERGRLNHLRDRNWAFLLERKGDPFLGMA